MAGRGPAPMPTAVLTLRGSKRARRRKHEPAPVHGVPGVPDDLTPEEAHAFTCLVNAAPWATASDVRVLAAAARLEALIAMCRLKRETDGAFVVTRDDHGVVRSIRKSPWLVTEIESTALLKSFLAEIGLTPSSRSRVSAGPPVPKIDEFAEFESALHRH